MSWRFNPALALLEIRGSPAKVAKPAKNTTPCPAALATLAILAGPQDENEEDAFHHKDLAYEICSVPSLTTNQCQEVESWPPETQKVFVALLDHFERRGFVLTEAEPLAYTTLQVLIQRREGLIRFAESKLPDEITGPVEAAKDVLGDGVQVEWRSAKDDPDDHKQAEQQSHLVRCRGCQQSERGEGDHNNALGLCHGKPWDGNRGQWPKSSHPCDSYKSQ